MAEEAYGDSLVEEAGLEWENEDCYRRQGYWKVNNERIKALMTAAGDIDLADNIHYLRVIREMLREVERA